MHLVYRVGQKLRLPAQIDSVPRPVFNAFSKSALACFQLLSAVQANTATHISYGKNWIEADGLANNPQWLPRVVLICASKSHDYYRAQQHLV